MTDLGSARRAVIQIVAEGGFVDPETQSQSTYAGSGSGFIISPEGLAVTNNHVVTGAALLRVYVDGEDRALNARVLGVSECNDLAVIDIEGDGFPYLAWYEGDIQVGLRIYAAGYPLGEPQYTLVDGIVAKEEAIGEFLPWASIDEVIEHSADALSGNSGGPILTQDGQVVAVHFAGRSSTGQSYAISRDVAIPVVEMLTTGVDIDTIGVNGEAYELHGYTGIWVSAVASGSAADQALIQGGDLIISMEGQPLAADGSMSDYCDILRSHDPDDTLSIEVYRSETQQLLKGQLNGRLLEVDEILGAAPTTAPPGTAAPPGDDGIPRVNDLGNIRASFPASWTDVWTDCIWGFSGENVGPCLAAGADLDRFPSEWDAAGAFIAASGTIGLSPTEYLDAPPNIMTSPPSECASYDGRIDYDDNVYAGYYDIWSGCGDTGATGMIIAAEPADKSFLVVVILKMINDEDLEALGAIIRTFMVDNADF